MRVIAGTYGGRRLQTAPGPATRPTSDRVREALFSILGDRVRSRGAQEATFVDHAAPAIRAIGGNLEALGADAQVVRADARRFLGGASRSGRSYDLVFLDPPYRSAASLGRDLSTALEAVLAPGGAVVAESDRRAPLEIDLPLQDERRYGDTLIRIHGPR
jgi:16S rRNA (guanine966-N2)-methyltransferase